MLQPWGQRGPHFVSLMFPQLSYRLETPASDASGLLGAVTKVVRETLRCGLLQALMALGVLIPASAPTIFNCSSGSDALTIEPGTGCGTWQ
jgi:hypothetical protein